MKNLFILLFPLLITTNVSGEPDGYSYITENSDGVEYYIHLYSIEIEDPKKRYWVIVNDVKTQTSRRIYQEINCKKKTLQILSMEGFTGLDITGGSTFSTTTGKLIYIAPDTVGDNFYDFLCSGS